MDRNLAFGLLAGAVVGLAVHEFLVTDWFVALGTAAVYAGATYLYLAFDSSLLEEQFRFEDRTDRVGHAVGVFGVSVSPLAFAQHYGGEGATIVFVTWFTGVVAFFLLASATSRHR
ncbi:hypothetical protein [Halobellus clavatus]|uniref:Uncharacterized protein n=1 Tax=Halobellus clavatus TaxID=660517 RepID=A0A1H3EFN9_9EURY|nr:hypothetical protein [Halobellus clavatus]SDX77563.1 hypothetical protein SAMN04487946_102260 [Halobellus clavatus]